MEHLHGGGSGTGGGRGAGQGREGFVVNPCLFIGVQLAILLFRQTLLNLPFIVRERVRRVSTLRWCRECGPAKAQAKREGHRREGRCQPAVGSL